MTRRVMVDIETASTHNSEALVLSVGLVDFVLNKREAIFTASKLWVLSLRDQLARGRSTMDSTLEWWARQSDAAKAHWLYPEQQPVRLNMFGQEFGQMITPETEVWANGTVFDLGNLSSLLGIPPWKYNAPTDARTIYKHTKQLRERPAFDARFDGPAHDPIADCKTQIWGLWEHWPEDDLPNAGSGGEG